MLQHGQFDVFCEGGVRELDTYQASRRQVTPGFNLRCYHLAASPCLRIDDAVKQPILWGVNASMVSRYTVVTPEYAWQDVRYVHCFRDALASACIAGVQHRNRQFASTDPDALLAIPCRAG